MQSIKISDAAMAMNDKSALEVLLVSAINDANEKVKAETATYTADLMNKIGRK